jgi:hypothetical protein
MTVMRWWALPGLLSAFVVAACAKTEPPAAPVVVALEVPPMDAGAAAPTPPPNPEKYVQNEEPPPDDSNTTTLVPLDDSMGSGKPPKSNGAFDRGKAASALGGVQLGRCAMPGGPSGPGHVTVTFDPSGRVSMANVDQGTFPGTLVGACIAKVYSTVKVPPFQGGAVRVGKSFYLP